MRAERATAGRIVFGPGWTPGVSSGGPARRRVGAAGSIRRAPAFLLALVLLHGAGVAAPAQTAFPLEDLESIQTYVEPVPGSMEQQVTARAMIDAPIATVWQVLVDYDRLGRSISMIRLEHIELLSRETTEVDLTLNMPWPLKDIYCPLEFTEDQKKLLVKWHNNGGCRGKVRGDIRLTAVGARTLLSFSISMKPDNAVPRWLMNWGFKQHLPREIQRIRELVRERGGEGRNEQALSALAGGPQHAAAP